MDYHARVTAEIANYERRIVIHDLPDIFHYWSNKYLAPMVVDVFGGNNLYGVFANELKISVLATGNPLIVSIGSGDGGVEIAIAQHLVQQGFHDFKFHCLELSPVLIGRAQAAIAQAKLEQYISFEQVDLSVWAPRNSYGAAFAHHSLHHIVALEHVFDTLKLALAPGGSFLTSDMIGRNGHMRWPETLDILHRIWRAMPDRYRYNHLLARHEVLYENWDCSSESFEGIRAQDILPLLHERFHFEKFCAWGGLIDLFIDRCFGHNLDPALPVDQMFIDNVWALNQAAIHLGVVTPTQIIAVMKKEAGALKSNGLLPKACIRWPDR